MKSYIENKHKLSYLRNTDWRRSASRRAPRVGIPRTAVRAFSTFLILALVFSLLPLQAHAMSLTAFTVSPDTDTRARLDWSSVAGARIYQLLRHNGANADMEITRIDVNTALDPLLYEDSGLQARTAYTYTVNAYSDVNCTALLDSKTAMVTTSEMIKPYNVSAVYDINAKTVGLAWSSSALAAGSIVRYTIGGTTASSVVASTSSAVLPADTSLPIQYTIQSTGSNSLTSQESNAITVTPVDPPIITASSTNGTASITWGAYSAIAQFQLERSQWNSTSWNAWTVVNSALSGQSTTDTPAAGGQYRYRLAAKSGSGYTGFSNISGTTKGMAAPTNLSVSITGTNSITLYWTNGTNNDADIQIRRKQSNGSYLTLGSVSSAAGIYTDTTVTVTPGGVYTYNIRAYESASNFSASIEASTTAAACSAPSSLTANVVSSSAVTLNWKDNSANESGFKIERLTDSGTFTQIATVSANTTTYTDSTVAVGNTYIYRVCSYNALGNSTYTSEVTVNAWDSVAPATLTATPFSATRIDLSWTYSGTASYNTIIERKTGTDGTWTVIYTTVLGALRYSDTGLSGNTRYFYRVRKSMGTGSSGIPYPNDNVGVSAYTYLGNLSLSGAAAANNTIYLTWSGNTSAADVVIERKMSNGAFSALTTVSSSTTGWYDNTGLVPSASYTYRIKAQSTTNESVYSNEATVQNLYLDAPSNLSVSVTTTNSSVELNWADNSTDETGFEIWRYVYGSGTYALYATVDKNVTKYTDSSIQMGVQYSYMVRAYVSSGSLYSPYSNSASIGAGLINPPTNLYYTYISNSQVLLRWTDTSDNESGFKVEWKIGADGTWGVYAWVVPNTTAYTMTNLNPYTKYYFRIRAYNATGNSDSLSGELLVSTAVPAAPSEVSVVPLSATQIRITWKDNSDSEDGFRILKKPANAYYFQPLAEVAKNMTIYTDSSLTPGMRYSYKVVSYNATGSSESSAVETKTNTKVTFSDLRKTASWAKDAIENMAGMGIMKGVTATKFQPDNTISKAEFTAMILRAFKLETSPVGNLTDVKSNKWYYREVMTAENLGIISGDAGKRFYPERAITREEIAVMLVKAMSAAGKDVSGYDNSVLEKFTDKNKVTPAALSSMASLVGQGIMEGLPGSAIGPKATATRAQAAVFIYRAMNK